MISSNPILILSFVAAVSALTVNPTGDATTLANAVLGEGIKLISADYAGSPDSSGTYTNGPQGIRNAAVLTSGDATDTVPNADDAALDSKAKGTAGSTLCEALANNGGASFDAAVLTMEVELGSAFDGFSAEFVFATEEYPEYVGSKFNDVFGIYVDSKQVAFDNSNAPITVNGPFFSSGNVLTPPNSGSSYQGSTPLLKSGAKAAAGKHTIVIAICDISDRIRDSSVFVAINACKGDDCKAGTSIVNPPKPGHNGTASYYPTGGYGYPTAKPTYVPTGYTHAPEPTSCLTLTSTATYTTTTCAADGACYPTTTCETSKYTVTPTVYTPECTTSTYTTCGYGGSCHTKYVTYTPAPVTTYSVPAPAYNTTSCSTEYIPAKTYTSTPACETSTYTTCAKPGACYTTYSTYTPVPTVYTVPGYTHTYTETPAAYYTAPAVPTYTATYACPGSPYCPATYTGPAYQCPGSEYCATATYAHNVTGPTVVPPQFTGAATRARVTGALLAVVGAVAALL